MSMKGVKNSSIFKNMYVKKSQFTPINASTPIHFLF